MILRTDSSGSLTNHFVWHFQSLAEGTSPPGQFRHASAGRRLLFPPRESGRETVRVVTVTVAVVNVVLAVEGTPGGVIMLDAGIGNLGGGVHLSQDVFRVGQPSAAKGKIRINRDRNLFPQVNYKARNTSRES